MSTLEDYAAVAGSDAIAQMRQLAAHLQGAKVVHINSTRVGGGVAEILAKLVPLMGELGLEARWDVLTGESGFFECTKAIHNALQGSMLPLSESRRLSYEDTNARNAEVLRPLLQDADFVFVHDPQPAALLRHFPERKGKWIWRCHIDISHPFRPVWRYLRHFVAPYDASVFSLAAFAQELPHPQYLIPPSIDPLSEKNIPLPAEEIRQTFDRYHLDPQRPVLLQVSRFDHFKDPLGVIRSYRLAKGFAPALQLVLAGGGATDDPEGATILREVQAAASDDPDVHVLLLPPDAHREINALQRAADVIVQKSLREGFGLTVTEALWKSKPVIGGNVGGIRLQVVNHHTGFLVDTPEGAALRIRYLLHHPEKVRVMGRQAHRFVRHNFLITRHLREYLTLMVALVHGSEDRVELR